MRIDLQLFGGRGSSSGSAPAGATGGLNPKDILGARGMTNERERYAPEVDEVLKATRLLSSEFGVDTIPEDLQIARLAPSAAGVMAYYDARGNLAINEAYFDNAKMTGVYDASVADGFHPGRGNKTAMQAVAAHEYGHRLAETVSQKEGKGSTFAPLNTVEQSIVDNAAKRLGKTSASMGQSISRYAQQNAAECIAEAVADWYCNTSKAKPESKAIVKEIKSRLRP